MKKINFTLIGIIILILLNLGTLSYLWCGSCHRRYNQNTTCSRDGKSGFHHKGMSKGCCGYHGEGYRGSCSPHGMRMRHKGMYLIQELDLTDAQTEKLKDIRKNAWEEKKALKPQMDTLRKEEFQLLKDGKLDSTKASALAAQAGQYKEQMEWIKMKKLMAMRAVLTPEQREKLKKIDFSRKRCQNCKHTEHKPNTDNIPMDEKGSDKK